MSIQTFERLKDKAELGDSDAQYDLSVVYAKGLFGVSKDEKSCIHWLTLASDNGKK